MTTSLQRVSDGIVAEGDAKTSDPLAIRILQSKTLRDAVACRGRRQHDRARIRLRAEFPREGQIERFVVQARRRVRNAEEC